MPAVSDISVSLMSQRHKKRLTNKIIVDTKSCKAFRRFAPIFS